jgi:cytochrome P450
MASITLDEFLDKPEFYRDPYPVYCELRATDPVHWSEIMGSWVLTRYDDVVASMRDPRRFSNAGRHALSLDRLPEEVRKKAKPIYDHYAVGLIHTDPPDHTRMRALINKVFTVRAIESLRPRVQKIVDDLLDAAASNGEMDIMAALAYPLPVAIISQILGIPAEDNENFAYWNEGVNELTASGRTTEANLERGLPIFQHLRTYLRELIEKRRRDPQDDLLSALVMVEEEGDRLSEEELITNYQTLITAGFETTMNLIGTGLLTLLRHPEQLARLQADPSLTESAVEELLRFETPFQRNWRVAAQDVELGGKRIERGQLVAQMLGAANRDPEIFPDPDRLDITRNSGRHIAFGYGIHFCIGAPLARIEADIAFKSLLSRFPALRLKYDKVEWREEIVFRGMNSLMVQF